MKKLIALSFLAVLTACGGANDGDAATDTTTTLPPDTAVMNGMGTDTATNINSNTGTYSTDTTTQKKNDVRSSSSAYPDGNGTARDSGR